MGENVAMDLADAIEKYDLSEHVAELDEVGLTVVPQSTLGLDDEWFEQLRDAILHIGELRTGATFDLNLNPSATFNGRPGEIGHVILSHLIHEDQSFERVLTHPIKKALMTHMLGNKHRLAVSDGWIKWQTPDSWDGEATTGFHVDQAMVPPPWNWQVPHIANMNWCLTDYTRENGGLAYVPGSHREQRFPEPGEALSLSVAVEAPMGSLLLFNGGLWHGSYRKTTPGLRVTMLGQHCRPYMLPLQDFKGRIDDKMFTASEDPEYLGSLMREDESALRIDPYEVPRVD
tara:strand:- start:245 stop:1108 length:864 start_codon:yes stop_codon:yes gene_type:complete